MGIWKIGFILATFGCFIDIFYEGIQISLGLPTVAALRAFWAMRICFQNIHVYNLIKSIPNFLELTTIHFCFCLVWAFYIYELLPWLHNDYPDESYTTFWEAFQSISFCSVFSSYPNSLQTHNAVSYWYNYIYMGFIFFLNLIIIPIQVSWIFNSFRSRWLKILLKEW